MRWCSLGLTGHQSCRVSFSERLGTLTVHTAAEAIDVVEWEIAETALLAADGSGHR